MFMCNFCGSEIMICCKNDEIWLIITKDYYKAKEIIQQQINELYKSKICFEEHVISQYGAVTKFSNGLRICWMPPHDELLGFRINKLWADKDIDEKLVKTVYLPMLINKDIIWI